MNLQYQTMFETKQNFKQSISFGAVNRCSTFVLVLFLSSLAVVGQEIRDQKEAERVYKQSIIDQKLNKQYYDELHKCEKLLKEENYKSAEASCRLSITFANKLPKHSYIERYKANARTGVSLLRQHRAEESITYFERSLEVAKPNLTENDTETGEINFLIGQAYHIQNKVPEAISFYDKAESTFRAAFVAIDHEELRFRYPKVIKDILEVHLMLLEDSQMEAEAAKLRLRISECEKEFTKYLEN